ncbi:MAG: 2Fe-2S iron-sulfur cluster binding domain-containing protein [Actinobacteria bacterium]|nr:MAG: 2Fe-2S iron-sulfur cluster binding domain-containing protein [Actinomycetota bacterium]
MSTAELVTVRIDERSVQVPKGTGLIETAAAAGIEIPVFCYEPRLGAAVGACRMCLVEVEGMPPKPQAGCTLTAQDGMVVKTARTSEMARVAQNATLEFILVNHPLDCPVCDKGGECPLQDLTFRYGPGSTRMTFEKRTFEKPIPISPAISIDRERCILCYRCTRFSESVSEDNQLVALNRGAQTLIATFEDEPYTGAFTGNVTELCPVGALLPTQPRFQIRPWELQSVPTVCGLCPVGCNIDANQREGKVRRVLSRNHPEVDEGWLCDKGRFGFNHLYAEDRITDPLRRVRRRGLEEISWEDALDDAERLLREAGGRIAVALSGSETTEQAYALAKLVREGLGAHTAMLPEEIGGGLDAFRAPLSAIRDAELIVVLGDDPVVERAPIVDLWLRKARRAGAEIVEIGPAGDIQTAPGTTARACRRLIRGDLGDRLRASERAILIWSGGGAGGGSHLAKLAAELGLADKPGSGAFFLPETANGRGVAEAWAAVSDEEGPEPEPLSLLIVSGDEAAANPNVRALAERAERVLAITMFHSLAAGWADLVLPGTSYLERDGTYVNLEGRIQRLRRTSIPPAPDELAWIAQLAARFGIELSPYPSLVFAELSERAFGGVTYEDLGEQARLPERVPLEAAPAESPDEPVPAKPAAGALQLLRYRPLFSGAAVERVAELQFQRPARVIELSAKDAKRLGVKRGEPVGVRSNGTSLELRAAINKKLKAGVARIAEEHARDLHPTVEVSKP